MQEAAPQKHCSYTTEPALKALSASEVHKGIVQQREENAALLQKLEQEHNSLSKGFWITETILSCEYNAIRYGLKRTKSQEGSSFGKHAQCLSSV